MNSFFCSTTFSQNIYSVLILSLVNRVNFVHKCKKLSHPNVNPFDSYQPKNGHKIKVLVNFVSKKGLSSIEISALGKIFA